MDQTLLASAATSSKRVLTPRQVDILRLLANGFPDKEISAILHISEETVAYHLRVMFDQHQVHSRAGLVGVLARLLPSPAGIPDLQTGPTRTCSCVPLRFVTQYHPVNWILDEK